MDFTKTRRVPHIGYVIWLEDLGYHVISTQVLSVLKEAQAALKNDGRIYIIAFQNIRSYVKWNFVKTGLKADLRSRGIDLVICPIVTFPNKDNFYAPWSILVFWLMPQALFLLFFVCLIRRLKILHCRAYIGTLPAIVIKKIAGAKVIFDPRSPFIEEGVLSEKFKKGSITYKFWKSMEKRIWKKSDVSILITRSYLELFQNLSSHKTSYALIPNNVDSERFRPDPELRLSVRRKLGFQPEEIVFCYSGSLGKLWNNPCVYAHFIKMLRSSPLRYRFLFLTTHVSALMAAFKDNGIVPAEYVALSASLNEVPGYLAASDFGLNLMAHPDIRLGIKSVEYLSMGLPLIITANVLGACEIVEKYNVGYIIRDLNQVNFPEFIQFVRNRKEYSMRSRKTALEIFSTAIVGKKYSELYRSLQTNDQPHMPEAVLETI